jgi:hypothetical protein
VFGEAFVEQAQAYRCCLHVAPRELLVRSKAGRRSGTGGWSSGERVTSERSGLALGSSDTLHESTCRKLGSRMWATGAQDFRAKQTESLRCMLGGKAFSDGASGRS